MTFGTLSLLIAAGLIGPLVAAVAPGRVPVVVGELAAGVAIGATGTGWIDPSEPTTAFLGRVGFALLMFTAGTHVPLGNAALRPALRQGAIATAATVALAVPASLAIAAVTGLDHPALIALPIATSSAALVLPLLRESGAGHSSLVTVAWVTIADVATIVALPIALSAGQATRATLGGIAVTAAALTLLAAATRTRRARVVTWLRRQSRRLEWALDLRLSLLALTALAYLADRSGTSILVAGFSAGLIIGAIGEPRRLARQVRGIAHGFLVPLFFVVLGARLDLRALLTGPRDLALAGAIVATATLVHAIAARAIRQPISVGLTASAALGVPAAVVQIGLNRQLLTASQGAAIILAALLSIAVSTYGATRPVPGQAIGDDGAATRGG